jgi:hypothetical protein
VTAGDHPQSAANLLQGPRWPAVALAQNIRLAQHQVQKPGIAGRVEAAGMSAITRRINQDRLLPTVLLRCQSCQYRRRHW